MVNSGTLGGGLSDSDLARYATDASNNTVLVGPDGTEYEIINDISELIPEFTPSASASTGVKGTITRDASYIYLCTATNVWERVAVATW